MKSIVYFSIAIRIIILFALGVGGNFFMDWVNVNYPNFFGDYVEATPSYCKEGSKFRYSSEWGARHYWVNIGFVCLFLLSLIDAFIFTRKVILKHYNINI